MNVLFAFLHHLAAFVLVAALAIELALLGSELTPQNARRLQLVDLVYGVSAAAILLFGFLRVAYFEKGAPYYFHSASFIVKMSLFALIGLLSIYPTVQFLRWSKASRGGVVPVVPAATGRRLRTVIRLELALIVPLVLCAALMARGVGQLA